MTRPDFIPLDPSLYSSRGRSHPRAHPAFPFASSANPSPQRRRHGSQQHRGRLFTTPPDQIAPASSYTYENIGSPFEDALSPALVNQETELGLGLLTDKDERERPSSSPGESSGMGLGLGLGFGFEVEDESRIEKSEEAIKTAAGLAKRDFKDVKALIMASPNPESSSFQITNPALHLRNLQKRIPSANTLADPPSPRGSPDMVARYYDPLSPFQIYSPSTPESPVVPASPGPSQTTIALSVVLALVVLGMFGGVSLYLVKKKRRRREQDQLAEVEQLEKGLGGGKGPPVEVDPVPLWGKRLSHFDRESKRLGAPPPAHLRDPKRLSIGRSEKAKSRLSQSHLPVINEGGESDGDLVGRALNLELPMVVGVSELRLEGLVGSAIGDVHIGPDGATEPPIEDKMEQRPRPGSTLPSRYSSDLLLSMHMFQPADAVFQEPIGPPNTPEQPVTSPTGTTPDPSFFAHIASTALQGLQTGSAPAATSPDARRSSASSSVYTVDSSDSVILPPRSRSNSTAAIVDSPASSTFFSIPDFPSESKDSSPTSDSRTSTRPRSDSKSSTVESVKSIDLLRTAIGKRFAAGSKTFSLPPSPTTTSAAGATAAADSVYDRHAEGSIVLKSVGAEGITTVSSPVGKARPISERTSVVPVPTTPTIIARTALTDPFSPSYTSASKPSAPSPSTPTSTPLSSSHPTKTPSPAIPLPTPPAPAAHAHVQTRRAALISTFASSSNSASAGRDHTRFGITVKPSLLPLHARMQARAGMGGGLPRPATTYEAVASPPSPSPVGGSIGAAEELTKGKGAAGPGPASAALARASSLPTKMPSSILPPARRPSTTWRGMTLPSYSLPHSLPPLPEHPSFEAPPIQMQERSQTLPLPKSLPKPEMEIPTISITDPLNHTRPHPSQRSAISPSSTTSSFESGWELGPAWSASPRPSTPSFDDDDEDGEDDEGEEDEFAYDYGAHFAEFSSSSPTSTIFDPRSESIPEEDEEEERSDTETLREDRSGLGAFVIGGGEKGEGGSDSEEEGESGSEEEEDDGEDDGAGLEKFGMNFPRVPERGMGLHATLPVV